MKQITIVISIFFLPLITKAQMVVTDPAHMGETIAGHFKTLIQLEEQYNKLKQQYELTKGQIDKLKRMSEAVINFTSGEAFMDNLEKLIDETKTCGDAFFKSRLVLQEYKDMFLKELNEKLKEQRDLIAELELVNDIGSLELSDSDRLNLALRVYDKAREYTKEIKVYNARLYDVLEVFERRDAWKRIAAKINDIKLF